MDYSQEAGPSNYVRLDVAPREQGAAYTPGNGDVLFLNDKTTEQDFFNLLTYTQRKVAAARFRAWAGMADYEGDEFVSEDD